MKLLLVGQTKIDQFILPETIDGNYWFKIKDENGKIKDFANIDSKNEQWLIHKNEYLTLYQNNQEVSELYLNLYQVYIVKFRETIMVLYTLPTYETNYTYVKIKKPIIIIGSSSNCDIAYENDFISEIHTKLYQKEGKWYVENFGNKISTFLNEQSIRMKELKIGDTLFISGIYLIFMGSFCVITNPLNKLKISSVAFQKMEQSTYTYQNTEVPDLAELELYHENDYYQYTPRLRSRIEPKVVEIDDPPSSQIAEEMPLFYTLAPMLLMSMTSMVSGGMAIFRLASGEITFFNALPSLIMCIAMMGSAFIFPIITKRYNKKRQRQREELRQKKYSEYLEEKRKELDEIVREQTQILNENLISLESCYSLIENKKRIIWERKPKDDDFLTIRLGIGEVPLQLQLNYSKEKFTLQSDNLKEKVSHLTKHYRMLRDVPMPFNIGEKYIHAILGDRELSKQFILGLILQLVTFHSFVNLKLIFLLNDENKELFQFVKNLPHTWSNDKSIRFYATSLDEMKNVSLFLETIYTGRKTSLEESEQKESSFRSFEPYYQIITDDFRTVKNLGIINNILEDNQNYGFGISILASRLNELPNECKAYLYIDKTNSGYFENNLTTQNQKVFQIDSFPNLNMYQLSKTLANIPMKLESAESSLPKMITFLELYQAGKVEQLNILNRWKNSNPMTSLAAPIGVYPNGETFELDLHEKSHGPHGLIAGSTGSGKSEFIITYILSMAINYHPNEVQFVLIDYKGGGLAGAFENKETGFRLPHLAGTITNLDTVEMKRSLASIQSELRRRQQKFNEARDSLNESTIDIYKYQRLFRQGLVKEPISHLFIISDEFAELKSQQPEFMSQLISTARIGRSLGVHLILATQKPSGVVNDQIWSNSKFKVCLKVQDKSDSMEVIKRPDAAEIKETGRFYLQVGYNEYFALGQSAWAGAKYIPVDKPRKRLDDSISIVNQIGYVEKSLNDVVTKVTIEDLGEQITNVMSLLIATAKKVDVQAKKLWLDAIPELITLIDLRTKYNPQIIPYQIEPMIGEYDDPNNQRQELLKLNLTEDGNTIIYGMSGSGKENLLQTILYDTMVTHKPNEVNFYLIDFGAETLKVFRKFPHVGDVVTMDETEKLNNLFRMLLKELEIRKELFVDYGGTYQNYCKQSGFTVPQIIVMINNFEVFQENFENTGLTDTLIKLSRSSSKYGITFILTATALNSVRYKLSQNYPNVLSLRLTNKGDYSSIFGRTDGIEPSDYFGRGLVKLEGIYEFQTAFIAPSEELNETIKVTAQKLMNAYPDKAKAVPILPDKVTYDLLKNEITDLSTLPIGVEKESLNIAKYPLEHNLGHLFITKYLNNIENFYGELLKILSNYGINVILDGESIIDATKIGDATLETNDFKSMIAKLNADVNYRMQNEMENTRPIICVMIGMKRIFESLDSEGKEILKRMMTNMSTYKKYYKIIFLDTPENIKCVEYESWFKSCIDTNSGVWIGTGIDNQFLINLNNTTKEMRSEIPSNFGYIIIRGTAKQIKLIEESESIHNMETLI